MRLIDADALLDKFEWKVTSPLYVRIIRTMIKAAPTIYAVQHTDDVIQKMQDIEQAQIHKAYDLGYAEGKADAEPQWIPCDEQLPEGYQKAILCNRHGEMMIGSWTEFGWMTPCYFEKAVAWMPVPKPYEAERKEL